MSNINYILDENSDAPVNVTVGSSGSVNLDGIAPVDGLGVDIPEQVSDDCDERITARCIRAVSEGRSARSVVASARKAGVRLPESLKELIGKLDGLLGNYVVSCRFSPDSKGNYRGFIKYAIDCDCGDCGEEHEEEIGDGGINGFFNPKYVKVSRRRICSRTGLPVISSVDELDDEDKKEIFAKVVKVYPEVMRVKDRFDSEPAPRAIQLLFLSIGDKGDESGYTAEGDDVSMGRKRLEDGDVSASPDFADVFVPQQKGINFTVDGECPCGMEVNSNRCPMDF